MEERVKSLEKLLGNSSEKHAKEIEDAKAKLKDLHAALNTCAKAEHHANMEERMNAQLKDLNAAVNICAKAEHHATMEERVKSLEKLLGNSSEKHAKEIGDANERLKDFHAALKTAKAE